MFDILGRTFSIYRAALYGAAVNVHATAATVTTNELRTDDDDSENDQRYESSFSNYDITV